MGNMSIRVTKEELDAHGQTSVELPGGGYLAWLGVFHELHCVVCGDESFLHTPALQLVCALSCLNAQRQNCFPDTCQVLTSSRKFSASGATETTTMAI